MDLEIDDWGIEPEKTGLICEKCGYEDSLNCYLWNDEKGDDEIAEVLCGTHAAESGYCCCCGNYFAGMTSFDFHHPGYCDNCYEEVRSDCDDDDDFDF